MLADAGDSMHELFYEGDIAEIIIDGNYAYSDQRVLWLFLALKFQICWLMQGTPCMNCFTKEI